MSDSASGSTTRPVTSKARGVCKYYATERGCWAGHNCKFLHGDATHTPYDESKTCRFYAAGFCKRGAQCWFSHVKGKEKEVIDDEDDLCSICFEKPITYGLLTGCSHVFCIACIKQWRDPGSKSIDVVESGNTKRCPMCREPAKFIIPSSKFYRQGQEAKDAAMARYMDSMKRVPCKYFQKSLSSIPPSPFCPFGRDCFYQHQNPDGSDHVSFQGVEECMRHYGHHFPDLRDLPPMSTALPHRSDLIRSLENVFAHSARLGLDPPLRGINDGGSGDEVAVMRRLELLADQMLASLAGQGPNSESESETDENEEPMPPLEFINPGTAVWPLPLMFDSDTDMPALASVSNSSDSEEEEDVDEDSDSSAEDGATEERIQTVRPFDLAFDQAREREIPEGLLVRLSNLWTSATPETEDLVTDFLEPPTLQGTDTEASPSLNVHVDEDGEADDEACMSPLEREPPFVTDGRGRVVWSSSSDSRQSYDNTSNHCASTSIPGAFPSSPPTRNSVPAKKPPTPRPSSGFTTDGRGRVIGTTSAREEATGEAEPQGGSVAPVQTRSFLGRVFDVFF
ncbi:hypothetical protein B0H10DRAFT_2018028 [Mycena sp. CBHHK59/15]|nr:hypothetical protein B0H10DRAFT_2018028 [Mycena sp. CBHHK59/15]